MKLEGNYTALVTPFLKNGDVDYKALENLINLQIKNNADGIVVLGSTAEATALSEYDKIKITQLASKIVNGTIPIIAGVQAYTTQQALEQIHARFINGASAILIAPPPYIKPTEKGIFEFYKFIADQSYIPIIMYNIPSRTGVHINADTVVKLSSHPNIIGIKEASGNLTYSHQIFLNTSNQNFTLIVGNDNLLLPMLSVGAKAIISVVGNIMPNLCHDIIECYNSNNAKEATEIYNCFAPLINVLSIETNPIPIKYIMHRLKLIKPYLSTPLKYTSPKVKHKIDMCLNEYL